MDESILTSIKKLLGIYEENDDFDADLIMHINSVIMNLRHMGVGPVGGFMITDNSSIWSDYLGEIGIEQFAAVRSLIFLKVKLLFDPPTSGSVMESYKQLISEFEYRLYFEAEFPTITRGD